MITARMHYAGGKGKAYRDIINLMPPHRRYVEAFLGAGAVLRHKRPASVSIGVDLDPAVATMWSRLEHPGLTFVHGDAIETMTAMSLDRGDLVFCDPPYHPDTRRRRRCYRHDYAEADHERLLGFLLSLRCAVVLSGYDNPLYGEALTGWHRTDYAAVTHRGMVVESAWTNFVPGPPLHDYSFVGGDFRARERFRRRADGLARRIARSDELELHAALARIASDNPAAVLAAAAGIADTPP